MADPKRVDGGSGLQGVASLLQLLGGTQQKTQSTGDTSALQGVLAQLQGVDPNAQLATIMQTLAGQTPGLQARFSNAIGARSGGNSAVQGALSKLFSDTAVKAQQQISQQQQANLATQGQVASDIARATAGQKQTSGTNLGRAGLGLAGLQAAGQIANSDLFKKGKSALSGLFDSGGSSGTPALTSASAAPELAGAFDFSPTTDSFGSGISDGVASAFGGIGDFFSSGAGDAGTAAGDAVSGAGDSDWFGSAIDSVSDFFGFADGGLVGRDGKRSGIPRVEEALDRAENPEKYSEEDEDRAAMKRANAARKAEKSGKKLSKYDEDSKMVDKSTGIRFADGGVVSVRSGGGRRSSAPTYTPLEAIQSLAQQGRGVLNPESLGVQRDRSGLSPSDSTAASPVGMGTGTGAMASMVAQNQQDVANAFAQAMLGQVGVPVIGKGPLGLVQAMLSAGMQEQSFMSALNTSQDPLGAMAVANGLLSPSAAAAMGSDVLGAAANAVSVANNTDPMDALMSVTAAFGTALGEAEASEAAQAAEGLAASETDTGNLGDASAGEGGFGSDGTGSTGDDGGLGGTAGSGNSGGDDGAGEGGEGGEGSGSDGGGDGSSGDGYRHGGAVDGPGTSRSDSIHAKLSDGEYVVSADVVEKLGVGFFDELQKQFHAYSNPGI